MSKNNDNPHRAGELRRAILETLEMASPYALPEPTLRTAVDGRVRPPCGDAEFDDAMLALSRRAAVATVPDALDDDLVKWTIKEAGRALIA